MTAFLPRCFTGPRSVTLRAATPGMFPVSVLLAVLFASGCIEESPPTGELPAEALEARDLDDDDRLVPPLPDPVADPADPAGTGEHAASSPGGEDSLAVPSSGLSVSVLDWGATQKLVDECRGKVVVIDVWSTYCEPCLREFPNLVKLHQEHPDRVACIALNTNYEGLADEPAESFREEIQRFAKEQDAQFRHVILSMPAEEFYDEIDLGGPPAVFVYDAQGQLVRRFDNSDLSAGEFTYAKNVVPLVEELLAAP